jgi:L-ribulose-5-phosphate 3-epimerase
MDLSIGRRGFIGSAGAALAAALTLDVAPRVSASASEDISKTPRLMVGCCAYSFRKYLEPGKMTMKDFIRKGVELRCQGVDMTGYWWESSTDAAYIASLRNLAFKCGMPFSGAACGSSMVQADAGKRAQVLEEIKRWVDATELLGAPHLRIFAGRLPSGATAGKGLDWCVEIMKPACDYAGKKGITLGVENHDGITQRADACLELIRRVDSPFGGINLDISNFVAGSDAEQYQQIEACVPVATHTHIRDTFGDSHRPIDLDRVWQIFAKGGFKGYMSVEYEGEEDEMTGVPKLLERSRALCRKYSSV